jgi:hypothetical protein
VTAQSAIHGAACPSGCQPQCATATIYVPQWETRYINVLETRYRQELRQKRSRTYLTVYDDVPKIKNYIVQIPQQRSRSYTVNRTEEFQVPVQENFTVMVPKPQQREISVDREEQYQVPVEVPYTVMTPVKREVQQTSYKVVVDKEPYQVRYTVEVPVERTRIVTEYEKVPVVKKVRKPVIRMVEQKLTRAKVEYTTEIQTREIEEEYVVYEKKSMNVT